MKAMDHPSFQHTSTTQNSGIWIQLSHVRIFSCQKKKLRQFIRIQLPHFVKSFVSCHLITPLIQPHLQNKNRKGHNNGHNNGNLHSEMFVPSRCPWLLDDFGFAWGLSVHTQLQVRIGLRAEQTSAAVKLRRRNCNRTRFMPRREQNIVFPFPPLEAEKSKWSVRSCLKGKGKKKQLFFFRLCTSPDM